MRIKSLPFLIALASASAFAADGSSLSVKSVLPAWAVRGDAAPNAQRPEAPKPAADARESGASRPAPAKAENFVPFGPGAAVANTPRPSCSFLDQNLPKDTVVIAAGAHNGRRLDYQIDTSGSNAAQFDVAVHADKPVALLLASYNPSIWNIGWTQGTKIVAVYATGYHRQAIAGLPKSVPTIVSSHTEQGLCGYHLLGGDSGSDLSWVNPKSRSVFGKEVTRVYDKASNGVIDIVESAKAKKRFITSDDTPPESYLDKTAPRAGRAGIDDAVANGSLRPASREDLAAVRQAFADAQSSIVANKKSDIPPVAGSSPKAPPASYGPPLHYHQAYVVVKELVLPAGLYGAHSATFIVPKGTPRPKGELGHSTLIDLNHGASCTGTICQMRP